MKIMDNKRLLKVLNSMEILDWSCAGEECEYVLVEDNEENRNMLLKAGLTKEDIEDADLLNEAIVTCEDYFQGMNKDELMHRNRILSIAYLALKHEESKKATE